MTGNCGCRGGLCRPDNTKLLSSLLLCAVMAGWVYADWRIREVARINTGVIWTQGYVLGYQSACDTYPLLIYSSDIPHQGTWGIYFYRYAPLNRYVLARVDTGNGGSGLVPGNLLPFAAGDVDNDSSQDLVGFVGEYGPTQCYVLAALYEPSALGYPDSLAWRGRYDSVPYGYYGETYDITDLDRDGKKEIAFCYTGRARLLVYETVRNDSLRRTIDLPCSTGFRLAFGDFDQDGKTEIATAGLRWLNQVVVYKCTGNDQVVPWDTAFITHPNGHDAFSGASIDGTHRAALFVSFWSVNGDIQLFQFEPTQGTRGYEPFRVDSTGFATDEVNARSVCGDIDADGIDEILWSCGSQIQAYRCTGPRQFERIWYWWNEGSNSANVNLYDMNGNGYNEILMSGGNRTIIFEIEAVKTTRPVPHEVVHPGPYSTTWEKYEPPRCDSFSLLYTTDGGKTWVPIAHGLSPNDTSYLWNVPDVRSDSCKIRIFAYGPGWQLDETDSCFRILPAGVEEAQAVLETRLLGISPNPLSQQTRIRFQLREPGRVSLRISDPSGRTVNSGVSLYGRAGYYELTWNAHGFSDGIYFLTLDAPGHRSTAKLVLNR